MAQPGYKCPICLGSGIYKGTTCFVCGGDGRLDNSLLDTILIKTFSLPIATKLIYSYQVVEVINPTEYASLVDAAKDGLRIILSCGVLDLVHTGNIYLNLMAIFGNSPITKAAITAL